MNLLAVYVKHKRRLRLVFNTSLAASAFTNIAFYTITSQDSVGHAPAVVAALAISGSPFEVELALGDDLVGGGKYLLTLTAVPAVDTTTSSDAQQFFFGSSSIVPNVEQVASDAEVLLYGRDIVWTGTDFGELPTGDLATVSGASNAQAALYRRLFADGLPWDATYGPGARKYVNGTAPAVGSLKGAIIAQCAQDDRIKSASVDIETDSNHLPVFLVTPTFISGDSAKTITVTVPTT